MTISVALQEAAKKLQPKRITCALDRDIGRLEAEILLAHVLGKDRAWIIAHGEELLRPIFENKFQAFVQRRTKNEPVAYILGYKEFYGRNFKVTRDVLIPRPETELMVDLISTSCIPHPASPLFIWDLGTGSGALAITLAKEIRDAAILATDVSAKALTVARQNAKQLAVTDRIRFGRADLLDAKTKNYLRSASSEFPTLIIAANLPYLPDSDKKILDPDVVMYEPQTALFAGRDGLALINKFLTQLAHQRDSLGFESVEVYLEFDPPQAAALKELAKKLFPKAKTKIHKDLAKRNRVFVLSLR
ncbi:MAG: peptide chain release factor N(5)-glutamine methyltransferase [Patescibacteria group bacterium]